MVLVLLTSLNFQGTVLAPFLFALYAADCRSTDESKNLQMIQNWLEKNNDKDAIYHKQIENCDKHVLQ